MTIFISVAEDYNFQNDANNLCDTKRIRLDETFR